MVDAVGSVGSSGVVPAAAADQSSGIGQLGSDAFLKLLVAQLRYQNPLEPADGTEFLQQTAQFSTVESLQTISEINQRLMGLQQVGLALDIVGKEVTALDAEGHQITGSVDAVRFVDDGPILTVAGVEVPLSDVLSVEPAEPEAAPVYAAPVQAPAAADDAPAADASAGAASDPVAAAEATAETNSDT